MKKKKWLDLFIVFYLIVISVIIRSYYMSTINTLYASGEYLTAAFNVNGSSVSLTSFDIKGIYTWLLSEVMLFFGRKSIFALYLNIVIQTIDVILIYGCFRFVLGKLISSIIAILVSTIPFFYQTISDISPYNLTNCFILLSIYVVILVVYLIIKGVSHVKQSVIDEENEMKAQELSEESNESDESLGNNETEVNDSMEPNDVNETDDVYKVSELDEVNDASKTSDLNDVNDVPEVSESVEVSEANDISEAMEEPDLAVEAALTNETVSEEKKIKKNDEDFSSDEMNMVEKNTSLETPLPMPKKHIKREMNYAFDPKFDMMHYDLEDMTGKDFYDIE